MKIICDNCATKYSIADEKVRGKVFKIRCKKCSHIIVVRGQEKAEEAPPQDDVAKAFDQKETRVFDYSGFDAGEAGAPAAAAAPQGEVPSWHVVIDREQVGPMTVSEVKERFARGEVDAESYAWREGFEDWIRLASIPDFADLFAGTAAAPNPFVQPAAQPGFPDVEAGVFGSSGIGHSTAAAGAGVDDGADLFGSPAPTTQGFAPEASPVFASASAPPEPEARPMFTAPPSDDDEGLPGGISSGGGGMFAAASAGGSLGAVSSGSPRVEVRPMTGQRNENSVLFSLSNLSAIATSGPSPAKETPKVGVTAPAAEGSGLIDIRAMAQASLATSKPVDGGSVDDLPSFAPSFSPVAAPVLLPTADEGIPKWVWPIIGVGGLLVIAIVVMVVMLAGKGKQQIPVASTGVMVQAPSGATPQPMGTGPAAPSGASASGTKVAMASGPSGTAAPSVAPGPSGAAPATPEKKEPTKAAPAAAKEPKEHKEAKVKEPKEHKEPREPKAVPAAAKEPKEHKEAKPAGKKDDLDCLLDPSKPGCRGGKKPAAARESGGAAPAADAKERLEPSDIQRGMRGIKGRVQGCYDQYKVPGMVQVSVTISPAGRVSSASVSGKFAGTPTGACVAGAVKGARFDRFRGGALTITYPFVLR